jgi:O-antigen/teichoic acid export membrane protein
MLREKVIKGGVVLALRNIMAIGISVAGSIVILRAFDLKVYGFYALGMYWIGVLTGFIDFGINTYISRTQEKITDKFLGTMFTLILGLSVIGTLFTVGILGPFLTFFYKEDQVYPILALLSLTYILSAFGKVSMSLLERDLEYKTISAIELSSQFFYYIPAAIGALSGLGIIALILAELSKSLFKSSAALMARKVKLRITWDLSLSKQALVYGYGITASSGIYCLSALITPVVLGKIVGPEGVGIIRVCQNVLGQLSFFNSVVWRISIPALGKIQSGAQKVVKAVGEGAILQVFLVGLPLFGFMALSYWLVPLFYGVKWAPAAFVMVFACLPIAVNAIFSMQASALYAIGKNLEVAKWSMAYTLLLWPVSFLMISKFGYIGLPIAEILVLPTYYIQHRSFVKHFGSVNYKDILGILGVAYVFAVLAWFVHIPWLSLVIFLIPVIVFVWFSKNIRVLIAEIFFHFKNMVLNKAAA